MKLLSSRRCIYCGETKPATKFCRGRSHYIRKDGQTNSKWRFTNRCTKCKNLGITKFRNANREAVKRQRRRYIEEDRGNIYKHCVRRMWTYKRRAKLLNLSFNLTTDYLVTLFNNQKGQCYYTGEYMIVSNTLSNDRRNSLSLDRLNPADGYIQGNVVWCINLVNIMKQRMDEREFYEFMRHILNYTSNVSLLRKG